MDIKELSDIQSESGVIGTLIYHPDYIAHTDYLKPNYFFNVENGCIFWAIQELFKSGITNIDAYNISSKLQSHSGVQKTLDKYNLPAIQEFIELYKETARHSLEEYRLLADNIVTLSFKRDLVKKLHEIEADCYKKTVDLDLLSSNTYGSLDDLTKKYEEEAPKFTDDGKNLDLFTISRHIKRMENKQEKKNEINLENIDGTTIKIS